MTGPYSHAMAWWVIVVIVVVLYALFFAGVLWFGWCLAKLRGRR